MRVAAPEAGTNLVKRPGRLRGAAARARSSVATRLAESIRRRRRFVAGRRRRTNGGGAASSASWRAASASGIPAAASCARSAVGERYRRPASFSRGRAAGVRRARRAASRAASFAESSGVGDRPVDADRGIVPGDGELVAADRRARCTCTRPRRAPRRTQKPCAKSGRHPELAEVLGRERRRRPSGRRSASRAGCRRRRRRSRPRCTRTSLPCERGQLRVQAAQRAAARPRVVVLHERRRRCPGPANLPAWKVSRKKPRSSRKTSGSTIRTPGSAVGLELHEAGVASRALAHEAAQVVAVLGLAQLGRRGARASAP